MANAQRTELVFQRTDNSIYSARVSVHSTAAAEACASADSDCIVFIK